MSKARLTENNSLARATLFLLALIIIIRIVSIWIMGPMPQDAYYFFYSQHPDLSYFDHPPAIAYLIKLFTFLFGKEVFAIKLAISCLTVLTTLSVYKLGKLFYPEEKNKIILLFLSTLMVSILSLVSTPDTPLLFFWSLALLALHSALFRDKKSYWLIAGVLMGLAFDSKYTAIFLPAGLILFLFLSNSKRKYLLSIWPWLSILIMIAVASPVIIWNVHNHFASFAFQGKQRMQSAAQLQFNFRFLLGLIGHQLFLLIPVLFISIFYFLYHLIKKYRGNWKQIPAKTTFLLSFFLPIFLAFLFISPIYWVKINWMMPGYITGIILVSNVISNKWLNVQVVISFIVHFALLIELCFYPVNIKSDDTWMGWKELDEKVDLLKRTTGADFVFSADNYKTSAELNLFSDEFIYGQNVIGENALEFDYIGTNLANLNSEDALFINSDPNFKDELKAAEVPPELSPYFKSISQLEPILIKKDGKTIRKFYVFLCKDYKFLKKK